MPVPAASTRPKRLFRRFGRDERGSAAVEFSLVAVPFFALFFAIVETGIVFFASQVLENGVQDSSRLIFTNQMTSTNTTAAQFKADLCPRLSVLMTCSSVDIDVKYYAPGTSITITDPITGGAYDNSSLGFTIPPLNSTGTVVVRAFYQWPLIVTGLGYNIANINRGSTSSKRLLSATAAFHVEPPP